MLVTLQQISNIMPSTGVLPPQASWFITYPAHSLGPRLDHLYTQRFLLLEQKDNIRNLTDIQITNSSFYIEYPCCDTRTLYGHSNIYFRPNKYSNFFKIWSSPQFEQFQLKSGYYNRHTNELNLLNWASKCSNSVVLF